MLQRDRPWLREDRAALVSRTLAVLVDADLLTAADTMPAPRDDRPAIDPRVWLAHVCFERSADQDLEEALVEEYRGFAVSLATDYHRQQMSLDDLIQVALEGLVISLQRFEVARRIPFLGFAKPTVSGALKRHFRDFGWSVRVPRSVHEAAPTLRTTRDTLTSELGRVPTLEEQANRMGAPVGELLAVQRASNARSVRSIEADIGGGQTLADTLGRPDPHLARAIDHLVLRRAFARLSTDDRDLITLYFFREHTQSELAEMYRVSQMQISRRLAAAVQQLRDYFAV